MRNRNTEDIRWADRINTRLLILIFALTIFPILVFGFIVIRMNSNRITEEVATQNELLARNARINAESLIGNIASKMAIVSDALAENEKFQENSNETLNLFLKAIPEILSITMTDISGKVIVYSSRVDISIIYSEDEIDLSNFYLSLEGESTFSSVTRSDNGTPIINVAVPIMNNENRTVIGVLIAKISLRNLLDEITRLTIGSSGHIFIVEKNGKIISHRNLSLVLTGEKLSYSPLTHLDINEITDSEVHTYQDDNHVEVLGTFSKSNLLGWIIVAEQPVSEALASSRTFTRLLTLFIIAGSLLAIILSTLYIKQITVPLENLVLATGEIGKGHLETLVEEKRNDEIGALSKAINKMVSNLKIVTASRDDLDKEVVMRKQAEQLSIKTSDELRESNQDLEQFAYVASHDLQEPLRMVASYLQLLERKYEKKLDKEAKEYIEFAVDGANRMKTLINDLLAYSRVGTQGMQFEPTELEKVLEIAEKELNARIKENKAKITHDPLPRVMGDQSQLIQLFENLLSNALKFRGDANPLIHIAVKKSAGFWHIAVSDNGIGFDVHFLDKIFVIFQKLHNRSQYAGTGIGLAVSKKVVERLGGKIKAESTPGQGATFTFTIPQMEE